MKQAIELAKSVGYELPKEYLHWAQVVIDPKFFQALGKAMGDAQIIEDAGGKPDFCRMCANTTSGNCGSHKVIVIRTWRSDWHSFIDSLAQGQSPDDFFKNLLSNKE